MKKRMKQQEDPFNRMIGSLQNSLFYTFQEQIEQSVKNKKQTIHGQRAVNKQMPLTLKRNTFDFDVWTKKPEHHMDKMEDKLDKYFNADMFHEQTVEVPDVHSGKKKKVYQVKYNLSGQSVVDYSTPPKNAGRITIDGIQYQSLHHAKMTALKMLNSTKVNPSQRMKALQKLRRIEAYEKRNQMGFFI